MQIEWVAEFTFGNAGVSVMACAAPASRSVLATCHNVPIRTARFAHDPLCDLSAIIFRGHDDPDPC